MLGTTRFLVLALFFLRSFQSYPLVAQTLVPIQAQLVKRLTAKKLRVDEPILAKLLLPWKGSACDLRAGAIIQGHVVTQKAYSKTNKGSEIGIIFESGQCGGLEMKPMRLTLEAVIAANGSSSADSFNSEEMQQFGSTIGRGLSGTLRSVSQAPATVYVEPRRTKAEHAVTAGQVVGIPHLAISVGQGPDGASILRSTGRNVELDPGTQFVLLPSTKSAPGLTAYTTGATPDIAFLGSVPTSTKILPSTVAEESQVCVAPDCTMEAGQFDERTQDAQVTFSLTGLGYLPASAEREMSSFDYDASIAYLGPDQFLFTFNLHAMVHRSAADASSSHGLRIIRGVLIDLQEKKVTRVIDWRVPDSGRYLWPIGEDRVLIHVGQELRIYGPGLQLSSKIALDGPLAFVQISPDSEFLAVGALHERHTREIHQQLEEDEVGEPEEDVEIRLLDSRLKLRTKIVRSSRLSPPVLLNEGEVQIHTIARNRWQLEEHTWTGERRILTVVSSTCKPQAQSVPANLLFVLGCGRQIQWYGVYRGEGKVVLKRWSFSTELEQTAGGNVSRNAFAIRTTEAKVSRSPLAAFKPSDLKSSHVTVYRATDGHRIFSLGVADVMPAVQTFAISPRGDRLALLKSSEISFYQVSE